MTTMLIQIETIPLAINFPAIAHRCRVLLHRREFIRELTGYHWWLDAVS